MPLLRSNLFALPAAAARRWSAAVRRVSAGCSRLGVVVALLSLAGPLASGAPAQVNAVPQQAVGLDVIEHLGEKIPLDIELVDAAGKPVTLAKYFNQPTASGSGNKPVLLAMVYFRCPLVCPQVVSSIERVIADLPLGLGTDYNLLLVSFDPSEGPTEAFPQLESILSGYTKPLPEKIRDSVNVLTGTSANTRRLADALGFPYKYLPDSGQYSHGTVIFTLTPEGVISRNIYGVNYPISTVRLSLLEAASGKIGTVVDRFVMWCFHYDPKAGGYVLSAVRLMNVASIVTAVVLGGLVWLLFRAERKRRARRLLASRLSSSGSIPSTSPAPLA